MDRTRIVLVAFLLIFISMSKLLYGSISVTSRKTLDTDNNGRIDRIEITTDDVLNDDFSGLSVTVISYTVNGYSTGENNNDNIFEVIIGEISSGYDTDATPDVQINSNTSLGNGINGLVETDSSPVTPSDGAAPIVVNVTSSTSDGYYKAGDIINIQVEFSEAVKVPTGIPQLTLNSGGTAFYTGGTGSSILDFNYTVSDGENTFDLDYTGTDALSGNIRDSAGNIADKTLPAPGALGSLDYNKDIVIDTVNPVVSNVSAEESDGYYNAGKTINITVQYSETVIVDTAGGTPYITIQLDGGSTKDISYTDGSGTNTLIFTYTVTDGDNSSDLSYVDTTSLNLDGGTIKDLAGNDAVNTLPVPGDPGSLSYNKDIVIDTIPPQIVGNAETIDYDHDGRLDHYKLNFSERIRDSSFSATAYGGFVIEGHSITGHDNLYGDVSDNSILYIRFNETGYDTGETPDVTTSSVSLTDLAGNVLNGGTDYGPGDIAEVDTAPPAFTSIITQDSDKNGHLDGIALQFSEDVNVNDAGGAGDGLDCINIDGYEIDSENYGGNITKGNNFILKLKEIEAYDTGVRPSVTYTASGSSTITDGASNNMLNGETDSTVDGAGPYMLSATFHDVDSNDVDEGDYITVEFSETVQLQGGCTDVSDFVLLNSAYGDTFGTGAYLTDMVSGDSNIEITLGSNPYFILPNIWSGAGAGKPSGLGIKSGGTTCVTDTSNNPAVDTPEVDIGGSGSNMVASIVVSDGSDSFSQPDRDSTLMDVDILVSITLRYSALHVTLWYDVGADPDGLSNVNKDDRSLVASGSEKSWSVTIPGDDSEIVEGAIVRFILDVDGELYYSDGPASEGGHVPWSFSIIYEQKDRVTIRNNIINPKNGDIVYINYYISKSKRVRVEIFDLAGDRVKVLKNSKDNAGSHLLTWNGKNRKGQNCIPGLYYVLIKIDNKRYVKKVLIVK